MSYKTPIPEGSAGGATTNIQYNDSGNFAGSTGLTWNDANKAFLTQGALTQISMDDSAPVVYMRIRNVGAGTESLVNLDDGRMTIRANDSAIGSSEIGFNSSELLSSYTDSVTGNISQVSLQSNVAYLYNADSTTSSTVSVSPTSVSISTDENATNLTLTVDSSTNTVNSSGSIMVGSGVLGFNRLNSATPIGNGGTLWVDDNARRRWHFYNAVTAFAGMFDFSILSADRQYTFPNAGGTVALISDIPIAISGTYTPTFSAVVNGNPTMTAAQYMRVANTVTVSGTFTARSTAASNTVSSFEIDLPVASNFGNSFECGGTANATENVNSAIGIIASAANDTVIFKWLAQTTSATVFAYHFTYRVI